MLSKIQKVPEKVFIFYVIIVALYLKQIIKDDLILNVVTQTELELL